MKRITRTLLMAVASIGCASAELKVASLSTITTEIAHNVGGAAVRVTPLIRPGVDPHDFQPPP
jgi:ABC-type Zn uptake system ZnuABC Zn-binding protein ZnuA